MNKLFFSLFLLVLSEMSYASALSNSKTAEKAKTALIGVPVGAVLSCAGAPTESMSLGGVDYLTYRYKKCVATLTSSNGVITKVNYSGSKGPVLMPWQSCGKIFTGCFD
jgi:hypothetical protein